jgi:ATP-dependent Clp protease adaptor protein ClpS
MAPRPQHDDGGTATETAAERKLQKPRMYKVLLHNDDYTTREFVVAVLMSVFYRSESEALAIMLHVHNNGVGVAGVYPHDIARTKIQKTEALAREHEYPLRLSMEPEDT